VEEPLELLRHVIGHMPDSRAMLVVDLTVVPNLKITVVGKVSESSEDKAHSRS
jgi:hypothetical protein